VRNPDLTDDALRLLRAAGLACIGLVAVPALFQGAGRPDAFASWAGGLVSFVALFAWASVRPRAGRGGPLVAVAAQSGCVVLMVATQCRGQEGALLVLTALQLGRLLPRGPGLLWIALQSLGLFWAIQHHWSLRPAILLTPPYLGFQTLAYLLVELLEREGRLRAEAARGAERLRIARELHDAMGHHLAALSLNLEAARRDAPGSAALDTARDLARRLLDDVEGAVAGLRADAGLDLGRALEALAAAIPTPKVHIEAAGLDVRDPERAQAVLRCCQEIVTNAVKHAAARNVWISIRRRGDLIELEAHDDGAGGAAPARGRGLDGMQARLRAMGGAVAFGGAPGAGFRVRATLPAEAPA
jgi:signal transduction histidine kinase